MNLKSKSFSVYSTANQRYVRDLAIRLMMDEDMLKRNPGEEEFVIVVYTKKEAEALNDK